MILSKKKKALFEKRDKAFSNFLNSKPDSVNEIYYRHQIENFQMFFEMMNWEKQYMRWLDKTLDAIKLGKNLDKARKNPFENKEWKILREDAFRKEGRK